MGDTRSWVNGGLKGGQRTWTGTRHGRGLCVPLSRVGRPGIPYHKGDVRVRGVGVCLWAMKRRKFGVEFTGEESPWWELVGPTL